MRKHRTRAEILAKREQPIEKWAGWKNVPRPRVIKEQRPASHSKYTPHFGAKQRAKLERQALKLAA